MNRPIQIFVLVAAIALSAWLLADERAAMPGRLSAAHERNVSSCADCHEPWKGPSDAMCLQCHDFHRGSPLEEEIRFHEAEILCMECHTEHQGRNARISRMDHTLLHEDLHCGQCHYDRHHGMFGKDCRECHRITTWKVAGFRHPEQNGRECRRCHKPPISHGEAWFPRLVEKVHTSKAEDVRMDRIARRDCGQCHNTHRWRHLSIGP